MDVSDTEENLNVKEVETDDFNEQFSIGQTNILNNYALVNIQIDYQFRPSEIADMCLYDFVRLIGPQLPRKDREDTKERYARAILTLFLPWTSVDHLCQTDITWDQSLKLKADFFLPSSKTIIDNIQLLHECRKDRDEHLIQVIEQTQAAADNIDSVYIPTNFARDDLSQMDDSEDLVALLQFNDDHDDMTSELSESDVQINDMTTGVSELGPQTLNPNDAYIHDAILSIKQTGRFSHSTKNQSTAPHLSAPTTANQTNSIMNTESYHKEATTSHIRLNKIWKKQLNKAKQKAREKMLNGEEREHEDQNLAEATDVNRNVVDLDGESDIQSLTEQVTSIIAISFRKH
ncbi:unnamed protein product [Didymodactylos carnosus]|uniref:Uncharacterized protein n=1 Tax=Didymodactylos carnosus TaxID=1234261 RepID=A0A816AQI5_9BILA|nr:unnamed protein product [Didymodactylos carnosus]CAF4334758.1 unnamed protein product [Didymodactylos carnosus]CAF4478423.1 unnamed protein product [Didymodactylos carnosus]